MKLSSAYKGFKGYLKTVGNHISKTKNIENIWSIITKIGND